jgi:threonine dehydrogenase-like Zn-dependent dehydrogenase
MLVIIHHRELINIIWESGMGGNMAILAGVGPMGLGAIDYALHQDRKPGLLVVTDIDDNRLDKSLLNFYT